MKLPILLLMFDPSNIPNLLIYFYSLMWLTQLIMLGGWNLIFKIFKLVDDVVPSLCFITILVISILLLMIDPSSMPMSLIYFSSLMWLTQLIMLMCKFGLISTWWNLFLNPAPWYAFGTGVMMGMGMLFLMKFLIIAMKYFFF